MRVVESIAVRRSKKEKMRKQNEVGMKIEQCSNGLIDMYNYEGKSY